MCKIKYELKKFIFCMIDYRVIGFISCDVLGFVIIVSFVR